MLISISLFQFHRSDCTCPVSETFLLVIRQRAALNSVRRKRLRRTDIATASASAAKQNPVLFECVQRRHLSVTVCLCNTFDVHCVCIDLFCLSIRLSIVWSLIRPIVLPQGRAVRAHTVMAVHKNVAVYFWQ